MRMFYLFFICFVSLSLSVEGGIVQYKFFKKDVYRGNVAAYNLDDRVYFDLKDLSKQMKSGYNIYQASSRIVFSYNGKKLVISKNDVSYDGVEKSIFSKPFIVRGSRYFVLSDIFSSNSFTKIFETRFDIDFKEKTISIYEDINITAVKYFYYIEKSRVVIYTSEKLKYDTNIVGKTLVVTVNKGSYITSNDYITAGDGTINSVSVKQDRDSVKVLIELGPKYKSFEHSIASDPERIIIDVNSLKESVPDRIEGVEKSTTTLVLPDIIDNSQKSRYVVIIDPGHGGKDPGGKIISGKPEKQINLEISRKLYDIFSKDDRFDVRLTRNSDTFIPLFERSEFANKSRCDIFISIHANAHKNKKEKGFEIYFLSEKATDPWASEVADYENAAVEYEGGVFDYSGAALVLHSIARNEYINNGSLLAGYVSKFMEKKTPFENRGIKQAAFYVLRGTYCASILVETGFMTNIKDKKNLDNPSVQSKVAQAIYNGVLEYIKNRR